MYPGANHTRFDHSLGVAHLAERVCCHLQKERPDLVEDKDVMCVTIAGLCHDLGIICYDFVKIVVPSGPAH